MNASSLVEKAHHIGHAYKFYSQAVKRAPANAYAANGLAIILAEVSDRIIISFVMMMMMMMMMMMVMLIMMMLMVRVPCQRLCR
jgi:hypothetical protein